MQAPSLPYRIKRCRWRIARLIQLSAPEEIIENERKWLKRLEAAAAEEAAGKPN